MKKLTNTQLKAKKIPSVYPDSTKQQQAAAGTKPEMTIEPEVVPEVEEKTVKTSYGRQSKPVLVPIKTENVRCKHCQELFRSLYKLKQHMEKVHSDQLPEKLQPCQKSLPLGYVPAPLHGELLTRISMLKISHLLSQSLLFVIRLSLEKYKTVPLIFQNNILCDFCN